MAMAALDSSVKDKESNTYVLRATTDSKVACALDAALK